MFGIWNTLLRMFTYIYYTTNSCIHIRKNTMQFYKLRRLHYYSVGIEFDALSGYRLSWDASLFQSRCLVELLECTSKYSLIGSFPFFTLSLSRTPFLFFRDNAARFLLRFRQFVAGLSPRIPECDPRRVHEGLVMIEGTRERTSPTVGYLGFPCQVSFH